MKDLEIRPAFFQTSAKAIGYFLKASRVSHPRPSKHPTVWPLMGIHAHANSLWSISVSRLVHRRVAFDQTNFDSRRHAGEACDSTSCEWCKWQLRPSTVPPLLIEQRAPCCLQNPAWLGDSAGNHLCRHAAL